MVVESLPVEWAVPLTAAESARNVARLLVAVFLLSVSIYLQFAPRPPQRVPFRYRWPPFFISIALFYRSRSSDWVNLVGSDVILAGIYLAFLYLMWGQFIIVTKTYGLYPPQRHIALRLYDFWDWLRLRAKQVRGRLGSPESDENTDQ